jgi:hypothetical protein
MSPVLILLVLWVAVDAVIVGAMAVASHHASRRRQAPRTPLGLVWSEGRTVTQRRL